MSTKAIGIPICWAWLCFHGAALLQDCPAALWKNQPEAISVSLDPLVLLLRCFGLSQHVVQAPKEASARVVTESIWPTECLPSSCHESTLIERLCMD